MNNIKFYGVTVLPAWRKPPVLLFQRLIEEWEHTGNEINEWSGETWLESFIAHRNYITLRPVGLRYNDKRVTKILVKRGWPIPTEDGCDYEYYLIIQTGK